MARILVAADERRGANARLAKQLRAVIEEDGHEAAPLGANIQQFVAEADAVVALLDSPDPDSWATAALVASACLRKPNLAIHSGQAPDFVAACADTVLTVKTEQEIRDALPGFYQDIRPFAGRLVRDRIPDLVKQAGHDVTFRQVDRDDLPRFLKQKISKEADDLQMADLGAEKEEIGDLLEALETLIRVRRFDRDDLKRVKEGKSKRRGGFERGFVVEATQRAATQAEQESETPASEDVDDDGSGEDRSEDATADIPEVDAELAEDGSDESDDSEGRTPIFEA